MGSKGGDLSKCSFELPWGHTKPLQRVWSSASPFGLAALAAYCVALIRIEKMLGFFKKEV